MDAIEKKVQEIFETKVESTGAPPDDAPIPRQVTRLESALPVPFARINSVAAGSPAESAGLRTGDEIRLFGRVNIGNHSNLKAVAECVEESEGVRSHLGIYPRWV